MSSGARLPSHQSAVKFANLLKQSHSSKQIGRLIARHVKIPVLSMPRRLPTICTAQQCNLRHSSMISMETRFYASDAQEGLGVYIKTFGHSPTLVIEICKTLSATIIPDIYGGSLNTA